MEAGDDAWALFGEEGDGPQDGTDLRVAEAIQVIASRKQAAQNKVDEDARHDAAWRSLVDVQDSLASVWNRDSKDVGNDVSCKKQRQLEVWAPTLYSDTLDADRTLAETLKTHSQVGNEMHDVIAGACVNLLSSPSIFSIKSNLMCEGILRTIVDCDSIIACLAELCLRSLFALRKLAIANGFISYVSMQTFAMFSFVVGLMLSHRDLCETSLSNHFGSTASASRFAEACRKAEIQLSSAVLRQPSRHTAMFSHVCDSMSSRRFIVIDSFLNDEGELCERLRNGLLDFDAKGYMRPGELGNGIKSKRGDSIVWFTHDGHVEDVTDCVMPHDACKLLVSRMCMLVGILDWRLEAMDFMGAIYPPSNGLGFVKHVDNPVGDGRHFTAVYYLNKGWRSEDGATLRAWPLGASDAVEVTPEADRLVLFAADSIYHEVTPNVHKELGLHSKRCSVTVWFYLKSEVESWKERQKQSSK